MSDEIVTLTAANVNFGLWNVLAEDGHLGEYVFPTEVQQPWKLPMDVGVERPEGGDTCFVIRVYEKVTTDGGWDRGDVLQTFHINVTEVT